MTSLPFLAQITKDVDFIMKKIEIQRKTNWRVNDEHDAHLKIEIPMDGTEPFVQVTIEHLGQKELALLDSYGMHVRSIKTSDKEAFSVDVTFTFPKTISAMENVDGNNEVTI